MLVKFGIIFGNLFPLIAGFFLAGGNDYKLLLLTVIFSSGVIACACVINNYIDQDIDKLMERTKNRPLPLGTIQPKVALLFGVMIGFLSISALYFSSGFYSCLFGILGLFFYIVIYTILTKRTTVFSTHIGSISGAIPPIIGYCAVQSPNLEAFLLFLIVAIWQMPHTFAIHTFRQEDYKNANIKTLPSTLGLKYTAKSMLTYIAIYALLVITLFLYSNLNLFLLATAMCFSFFWFQKTLIFYKTLQLKPARMSFFASIINMMALSCLIIISKLFF